MTFFTGQDYLSYSQRQDSAFYESGERNISSISTAEQYAFSIQDTEDKALGIEKKGTRALRLDEILYSDAKQEVQKGIWAKITNDSAIDVIQSNLTHSYSEAYTSHNIKIIFSDLVQQFNAWEKTSLDESLLYVSNIKSILDNNAKYLEKNDETRVLLGLLELVFANNNWQRLGVGRIKALKQELARFRDGHIDWDKVTLLSTQLNRLQIGIMHEEPSDQVSA